MKVNKQGKIVLDKRDTRVGNFVFTDEPEYIKIQDINRSFILRLNKNTTNNAYVIEQMLKNKAEKDLMNVAIIHYAFNTEVKDGECINKTAVVLEGNRQRWKKRLGIKDVSDEEDAKILQEQKELHESMEELKDKE